MEAAECSGRSRKKNMSAEEKGKPNMSAPLSGGRETKRLRRGGKIGEDKHPMADSELELERSKLSRKRRTTRAERKAKLKQKILKKAGPKYWASVDLVKQRDNCYEGPEKSECEHVVNHPEFIKEYRMQTENCANTALEVYNLQNPGDEFELVEAISSSGFIHYGFWYHANFMAKPKNTKTSGGGDSSLKLFFAELNREIRSEDSPNPFICRCSIVDLDNKSKVLSGCGYCHRSEKIYHPVGQFKCGLFRYQVQLTLPATHFPPQSAQLAAWLRLNQTK